MNNTTLDTRTKYIRRAGLIALFGNAAIALEKIIIAIFGKSMALLGDGMDSSGDVLIALVTLVISRIISKPEDNEHPWGHRRAETVATMILSLVIFYCGAQLSVTAAGRILRRDYEVEISILTIAASIISVSGKIILTLFQTYYARKSGSSIIRANAENMKGDILLSTGVLAGLVASRLSGLPILDPIAAIIVGLWILKNGIKIFLEINMELMDGNTDKSIYKKIFDAAKSVPGVVNPHKARVRKIASAYDVDLDFEVSPDMSVYEAHEISEQVEAEIRKVVPEIYDIQIHVEPLGSDSHQPKEGYGLSPNEI